MYASPETLLNKATRGARGVLGCAVANEQGEFRFTQAPPANG